MPLEQKKICDQTSNMSPLVTRMDISPETINEKDRTVRVKYTTGERVFRRGWWEDDYYEELSTEPGHVRLGRMQSGNVPVLDTHANYTLRNVIGTVIEGNETEALIKFSGRDEVKGIWQDIVDGVIRNISVGYRVYEYEDITPDRKADETRILRAIDWEVFEISFVPVGADGAAGVRTNAEEKNRCVIVDGHRDNFNQTKENDMSKKVKTGAPEDKEVNGRSEDEIATNDAPEAPVSQEGQENDKPVDEKPVSDDNRSQGDDLYKKGADEERKRANEIRTIVRGVSLDEDFADTLIERGDTVEQARAAVIERMARQDENTPTSHARAQGGQDAIVSRKRGMEEYILHRVNPGKNEITDNARRFVGMSLLDLAREVVGYEECRGLNKMEIAKRAFHTTSDFPEILANVANKTLRAAYADTRRSFLPFSRQITLPDFKQAKRIAMSNASSLEEVVEDGEYKRGTFSDGAETIQLSTYGKIFTITRQAIINDDLDAFTRVPAKMAAAAARLENRLVYDILADNPVMADGTALFHADHGNLTDALLGVAGIGACRALARVQTDPSGEDILNYEPRQLIVPAALELQALQLKAAITPAQTGNANPFASSFDVIVEGYLDSKSTANYYMAIDPSQGDTIEYAYLDGQVGPYIESQNAFERDGLEIKVRHDFAAKAVDHRGLIKSTNNAS